MKQFDTIRAAFQPRKTDDLCGGAAAYIGRVCDWQCVWIVEEGIYQGQPAMAPRDSARWPFGWTPLCDLEPTAILIPRETVN